MRIADKHDLLVGRGCSLVKVLQEPPRQYETIDPSRRFAPVAEVLQRVAECSLSPPVRHIQFVQPVTGKLPERVALVSKISLAERQSVKLKSIIQATDREYLQQRNDLVEYLNHRNRRRFQASEKFYSDFSKHGLKKAEQNAKRDDQVTRFMAMGNTPWWEEFVRLAFSGRVGSEEEKFITKIARRPKMGLKEYYDYRKELEGKEGVNDRCLELLTWLNAKCHWADDKIIELLKLDEIRQRRSIPRRSRASSKPSSTKIV
jgi:hypothetical protein